MEEDFEITIEEAIIKVEYLLRKHKSFKKALTLMAKNLIRGRKRKYRISVDPFGDCMFD